jgi:hypothetical protein
MEKNMKKLSLKLLFLIVILGAGAIAASAQSRISFARGRTSATVSGRINGQMDRSYVLGAQAGQWLTDSVSSNNVCVEFTNGSTGISYETRSGNNYLYIINRCRNTTSFTITVSIVWGHD